jgi:hypothetical protein
MKIDTKLQRSRPGAREAGVTLIEMMIAILVLTLGLVGLSQLFVAATLNNSFVVSTAGGLNDAQRFIEQWKYIVATSSTTDGLSDPAITSSTYNTTTNQCDAFVSTLAGTGYTAAGSAYKESVWVFNNAGTLIGTGNPNYPPGVAAGTLKAPTQNARLIYIRMVPKTNDPRANQTLTLVAVIGGK